MGWRECSPFQIALTPPTVVAHNRQRIQVRNQNTCIRMHAIIDARHHRRAQHFTMSARGQAHKQESNTSHVSLERSSHMKRTMNAVLQSEPSLHTLHDTHQQTLPIINHSPNPCSATPRYQRCPQELSNGPRMLRVLASSLPTRGAKISSLTSAVLV